jgi:tetratricopeptide (TPR) repeat protein
MVMWLDRLEAELDNIRAALKYTLERNIEVELRLASALSWFWHVRGHKNEGIGWLEQGLSIEAIERSNQPLIPNRARIRGKALCVAGFLSLMLVETDKGAIFLEEGLTLFQGLGTVDRQGIAYVLLNLSRVAYNRMDLRRQKALLEESLALFQEMGDKFGMADCIHELGHCASDQGDYEQSRSLLEEHLALCQEIGDKDGNAFAFFALGYLASEQGNFNQAITYFEASLSLYREVGNRWGLCFVLSAQGQVAQLQGAYRRANIALEEALVLGQDLSDKHAIASRLNELGSVARSQGNYERAIQMHEEALFLFLEVGNQFAASYTLCNLGFAALARADSTQAVKMFDEALAISRETNDKLETAFALYGKGQVAKFQGNFALARKLNLDAMALFRQLDVLSDVARGEAYCFEAFAVMAVRQNQMMRAACLFGASEKFYAPLRFEFSAKERDEHDQAIAIALAAIGGDAFAAAHAEGKKLTLDEAVDYAIEGLQVGSAYYS